MAERTVLGVDFSGAASDNTKGKTWITEGQYSNGSLTISEPRPISRRELTERLKKQDYAVAGMDFPFSLPVAFANYWQPDADEMPDLWHAAYQLDNRKCFRSKVDNFAPAVADEVLRIGDMHVPGCYSCLHRTNPNMVPMTFEGMKLLHTLWEVGNFHVPPLPSSKEQSPVLLEVMPGAVLAAFGLPDKGYKNGTKSHQLRQEILDTISIASGIGLPNLNDCPENGYRERCLKYDDCLDSVVAAVAAALWYKDNTTFRKPSNETVTAISRPTSTRWASKEALGMREIDAARKEGWIYVPKPIRK
jgi:hypothetical protein